jgi:hypothetical protein
VWQGFWGGIATTCLGIFGTVFFVNQLLRRVEERRRSGLALHVRQRVSRIAFYETDKLLSVVQDRGQTEARPRACRDGLDVNRLPDGYAALVEATIDGMEVHLLRLEAGEWSAFGRTIDRSALEYARLIALFGYEMDAEVLRLMLRAEESAHRLAGIMAMRVDMPEHENRMRDTLENKATIMPTETRSLIAFHITRIMQANVELLRRA